MNTFSVFFDVIHGGIVSIIVILELSVSHKSCLELNFQVFGVISRVPCTPVFLRSRLCWSVDFFQLCWSILSFYDSFDNLNVFRLSWSVDFFRLCWSILTFSDSVDLLTFSDSVDLMTFSDYVDLLTFSDSVDHIWLTLFWCQALITLTSLPDSLNSSKL